ncbi:hypothetical protein C8Q76DRAFT_789388 [Earliella scabrosa]|nr:hypothetical protein C8Q76DRAFT_789388 [Earliella scabrosa]
MYSGQIHPDNNLTKPWNQTPQSPSDNSQEAQSSPAPPKSAGQTAGQQQQRKASISDKVIGTAEALAGKVTKNQGMIERGQARKGA